MKMTYGLVIGKIGLFATLSTVAAISAAQGVDQSNGELPPVCTMTVPLTKTIMEPEGSVLKVKLDTKLQSNVAHEGDKFTATLDIGKSKEYFGLPAGTKIEGHVVKAVAKEGKTAGTLELQPDSILLADGSKAPIMASFMKIDKRTITNDHGRLMTKSDYSGIGSNYVVTGAAVGVVAAAITGGDLLVGGILGAAIGFLIGQQAHNVHASDVTLKPGTVLGVRFNADTPIEMAMSSGERN